MLDETPAVETNEEAALHTEQATVQAETDWEAEYEKMKSERDNYKQGLLRAKGKLPPDEDSEESAVDVREEIARQVREGIQTALREKELNNKEEDVVQKIIRENKELRLAVKNRAGITNAASGTKSSDTEPQVNTSVWSAEQIAFFKERGIDPNKVADNIKKNA